MAHQFATEAAGPQRTRLQQGVVSILSGLLRPTGYLASVKAYPFTMETVGTPEDVAQFVATMSRAPAIAVHVGERTDEPGALNGYSWKGEFDLHVYLSSNNQRSQQVGRQEIDAAGLANDHADPGLHVIMEHVRELLIGVYVTSPIAADIKQIRPFREREIVTQPPVTIWEQLYKVRVMTQYDEFRTVSQLLESIHWRVSQNPSEAHRPNPATDSTTIDINTDPAGQDVVLFWPGDSNLVGQVVGQPAGVDGEADPAFAIMGPVPDVGYNKHYAQGSSDPVPYLTDVVGAVRAYNVAGVQNSGIQVPFARAMLDAGFDAAIYEHAISGIKMAQCAPGASFPTLPTGTENLWNASIARFDALGGRPRAMVWCVGGNDGFSAPDAAALLGFYTEAVNAALAKWGSDLVIVLVRNPAFQSIASTVPQLAAVNAAQDALAAAFPANVFVVWTDDLSGHSDHLHYDGNSAVILAQRCAYRMLDALGRPRIRPTGIPAVMGWGPLHTSSAGYSIPSPGMAIDKDREILTLFSQRATGADQPIAAPTTTGVQPWSLVVSARSFDGTSTTRMAVYTRSVTTADLVTGHGAMPPTTIPASGNPINGGRILVVRHPNAATTPTIAASSSGVNNTFGTSLSVGSPGGSGMCLALLGGYRTSANPNPVTVTFGAPASPLNLVGSNRTVVADFITHAAWSNGGPGSASVSFALPTLACGAQLVIN